MKKKNEKQFFSVKKCTMLKISMENNRIKIMIICLASLMPMLIDQLPFYFVRIGRIGKPLVIN